MYRVKEAHTKGELDGILALRYEVLRKPWNQPYESSTDGMEKKCVNAFIADSTGTVIACGRLQENENKIGQIRFMAVDEAYRGKGLGKLIVEFLEHKAIEMGLRKIELHARENALDFYKSRNYELKESSYKLWDIIQHFRMEKKL